MGKIPLISVVVICYQQEHTVARALDSILKQKTAYPFEIVIGEDSSPVDQTRMVCEHYAAEYPEVIRLLPKGPNKGLLQNYYDCLSQCRGKYIATCTGDDWWHNPDKLNLQVQFLEENQDYGVVHTEANFYNPDTDKYFYPVRPRDCPEGNVLEKMFTVNFIYAISVLFRKDLLKYADFEAWIKHRFVAEDHAMWLAFAPHTLFHYLPISTITYFSPQESASRSSSLDKRLEFIKGICRIQSYFHHRQNPSKPTLKKLTSFQKKWLIHEILLKKDYSKLKAYGAPILFRLAPFTIYLLRRILLKIRILFFQLVKGKSPIEFM